ncbi:hypothetical protein G7Y79_00051g086670 [Physcia stellaris]|nr:hypothetical protein G7Y79_00051g086670 [Physcia stellaris]
MQYSKTLITLLGLVPVFSECHMLMKTPTPYGASSLTNGPLDASGSDYPCKQRAGVYEKGSASNEMAVGAPQTLSFTGSAVHGGGSCQVSITKDLQPTKDSDFRVILSIEGGCPASVAGNLPPDEHGSGASQFQYSIPKDVAPGEYTLAWTWFNKIGNREMYMNCAPITVTGSKKRDVDNSTTAYELEDNMFKRDLSSLPEMFKANIQSVAGDCHTADSTDLQFPDPGQVVQKKGTGPLAPPTGNCKAASSGSSSAGSGSSSGASAGGASAGGASAGGAQAGGAQAVSPSPAPSAAAAGSGSPSPSAPVSEAPSATQSGDAIPTIYTIFGSEAPTPSGVAAASGAASPAAASPAAASPAAASPAAASPAAASPAAASAAAPSASAVASGSAGGSIAGSGSSSGALTCSPDGTKFQLPGGPMQPVALGTKCVNGAIGFANARRERAKFARRAYPGWN